MNKKVKTPNNKRTIKNWNIRPHLSIVTSDYQYVEKQSQNTVLVFKNINIWVSEWLLFNANSAIVHLYHGENRLIFNEMMMRSALY
jgi:hypothetical protein